MSQLVHEDGISRRQFVVRTIVVGAGLAVGVRLGFPVFRGSSPPDAAGTASRRAGPGGEVMHWVVISPDDTITLRIAQLEMGQGSATAMAQLLAEELEVDWSRIEVDFLDVATYLQAPEVFGRLSTSAVRGVRLSHLPLRIAGAQIRGMLIEAASMRLGVPSSELRAENGVVTHAASHSRLTFGELASHVAGIPVPAVESIELKPPSAWKYIGRSLPRLEGGAKIDGSAIYGSDVRLPGMKFAAIAMSPTLGSTLSAHDRDWALSQPGVHAVVAFPDAVAVVGDTWWEAKSVVEAMPKEWTESPGPRPSTDRTHRELREALSAPPDLVLHSRGDARAALSEAERRFTAEYSIPYLEHAPLEPLNCTAWIRAPSVDTSFEVQFDLWAPTQNPVRAFRAAERIARAPRSRGLRNFGERAAWAISRSVRASGRGTGNLHLTFAGGAFGRRQYFEHIEQAAGIAREFPGVPVQLLWSREEMMRNGRYHPMSVSRLEAGWDAGGALSAWAHRVAAPSGMDPARTRLGGRSVLYAVPNFLSEFSVRESGIPDGQLRGVSFVSTGFATQSFVDEMARETGRDPYQLQRELLDPGSTPPDVPSPELETEPVYPRTPAYRAGRLRAVLDEVASRADWGRPRGPGLGRGIAVQEAYDAFFATVAEVTLDGSGWFRVDRVVVVGDPGVLVNPDLARAQVEGGVAFALSLGLQEEITIEEGRTVQENLHEYRVLRMEEMPQVEVHWLLGEDGGWGGLEAVVATVIPAVTNAIYDAGGPRIRDLPIARHRILPRETMVAGPVDGSGRAM